MTIEQWIQQLHSSSFSGVLSLQYDHTKVIELACGYQDRTNKIKNNIDTSFAIASGTKLMTAIGIMKLVEEGRLSLSDNPFSYLDRTFPTYSQNVTITHLLSHTSGLPDYFDENNGNPGMIDVGVPWYSLEKPSDYLAVFPNKEMLFTPGTAFAYNNSAFVLLAVLIERITGDYYQFIQDTILSPAQMEHSGFYRFDQLPQNTAWGYLENGRTNQYHLPVIGGGDGGMYTNIEDMKLFWTALYEGIIVSKQTVEMMMKPVYQSETFQYGLGVWLEKEDTYYSPYIVGEDPGVSFQSGYDPVQKRLYTVISNTQHGAWEIVKELKNR